MSNFLGVLVVVGEDGTIQVPLDKLQTAGIKPNSKVEIFSDNLTYSLELQRNSVIFVV